MSSDDILKHLRKHTIKGRNKVNGRHHWCLTCDIIDEIERLRAERDDHKARLAIEAVTAPDADYDTMMDSLQARLRDLHAEVERLRAAGRYVDDLGVDWCVLHNGVRNEDSDRCDAFDWSDEEDMIDEAGEYLPCDLRPLAYREARRG